MGDADQHALQDVLLLVMPHLVCQHGYQLPNAMLLDQRIEQCNPFILAKAREEGPAKTDKVYLHGRKNPLPLRQDHPILLLLMHIRDEAHRRAIRHHRGLRAKQTGLSELDGIPGIGPKRKKILLEQFGSLTGVLDASIEDIASLPGMNQSLARNILRILGKQAEKNKIIIKS